MDRKSVERRNCERPPDIRSVPPARTKTFRQAAEKVNQTQMQAAVLFDETQ